MSERYRPHCRALTYARLRAVATATTVGPPEWRAGSYLGPTDPPAPGSDIAPATPDADLSRGWS